MPSSRAKALIASFVVRITHQKLISHVVPQHHLGEPMFEKARSFDSHCIRPPSHDGGKKCTVKRNIKHNRNVSDIDHLQYD